MREEITEKEILKLQQRAQSAMCTYTPPAKVDRVDAEQLYLLCERALERRQLKIKRRVLKIKRRRSK